MESDASADAVNGAATPVPSRQGLMHAAEWERHEALWLSWPHNRSDWPGKLAAVSWVYGEIVRYAARGETVHLLVNSGRVAVLARRVLDDCHAPADRVRMHVCPTDRGWCRDPGTVFLVARGAAPLVAVIGFQFNGWARYPNWHRDARVPRVAAEILGLPCIDPMVRGRPVVLEGGAIDVNGCGTVLATEECLLDRVCQVRNPGFSRADVVRVCADYLGAPNVIWLGRGIAGDDTHGHVDDLCRFVDARTVVLVHEPDGRDVNHAVLEENRERLEGARLEDGSRPAIVRLPMPAPLVFKGERLPASYANFVFTNAALLVPTFNDPNDRAALGILAELCPDRPVIGIHAVDLVLGLGALHCVSHEQPAV